MEKITIKEFMDNGGYNKTLKLIKNKITYFENHNRENYPDFDPKHFNYGNNLKEYQENYGVPFFDVPIDSTVTKGDKTYIVLDTFYTQMNIFFKSIFLRMFWTDYQITDKFTQYVYKNYKTYQYNNEFDTFEKLAKDCYDNSADIVEFTRDFIYNTDIKYFTKEDVLQPLLKCSGIIFPYNDDIPGLVLIADDMHDLPFYVEKHHDKITSGFNNAASNTVFYSKIIQIFKDFDTKYSFAPILDDNAKDIFDASFTYHRINGKFYFVPQLLLFYGKPQ